jgi:hypothetical protein
MNLYKCECIGNVGGPVTVYAVGNDPCFAREQILKMLDSRGYTQREVITICIIAKSDNQALVPLLVLPA